MTTIAVCTIHCHSEARVLKKLEENQRGALNKQVQASIVRRNV